MFIIENNIAIFSNGCLERTFQLMDSGLQSISMRNLQSGTEFLRKPVEEFAFRMNGKDYSSLSASGFHPVDGNIHTSVMYGGFTPWQHTVTDYGELLEITLQTESFTVTVQWQLLTGICGICKRLIFRNTSSRILKLDNVVFDDTCLAPGGDFAACDFYHGQDNAPESVNFMHCGDEDIIRAHHPELKEGYFMVSSAPGPLRYFMNYWHWNNTWNGYNRSNAPFTKYLQPQEEFHTDFSLIALYRGSLDAPECYQDIRDLIRFILPPLSPDNGIMFCTWITFYHKINQSLLLELIRKAAELNFDTFVVDDGWFTKDDRAVDLEKFPDGLEFIADAAHNAGLKFGLWYNIGTSYGLLDKRLDNCCVNADGNYKLSGKESMFCFASVHRDKIIADLTVLAEKYHVDYFKLDLSCILSPYGVQPLGCHSKEHAYHHGSEDSLIEMYRSMAKVRDVLTARFPDLLLDFSFETFGTDKPNVAALQYSQLHHVSNLCGAPDGQSMEKLRKTFYRWAKVLPPERILYGLLTFTGEENADVETLLTSFMGAPLVAGDLRKVNGQRLKALADTYNRMIRRGPLTEITILPDDPRYDGFCRSNKSGDTFAVVFNHEDTPLPLEEPGFAGWIDGENGMNPSAIPPHQCRMLLNMENIQKNI